MVIDLIYGVLIYNNFNYHLPLFYFYMYPSSLSSLSSLPYYLELDQSGSFQYIGAPAFRNVDSVSLLINCNAL